MKTKFSLWTRFRLLFRRTRISTDISSQGADLSVRTYFKNMDGKIYLVKREFFENSGEK